MGAYILVTAIYIVSAFQIQLGNPIFSKAVYPNQEICEGYKNEWLQQYPRGYQLSIEYTAYMQAQCFTVAEFEQTFGFNPLAPPEPDTSGPTE